MTSRDIEGGREPASTQDKSSTVQQEVRAVGEQLGDAARDATASAKNAVQHVREEGTALLHDARDVAADSYRSARDYAVEHAQDLSERARRVGSASADYARRAGSSTADFVSANALPLTLIGAGIGWLAWSLRARKQRELELEDGLYDEDFDAGYDGDFPLRERSVASARLQSGREGASQLAGQARDRAGALADRASQSASAIADRASQSASALAERASQSASALAERASHGVETVRSRVSGAASHLTEQARHLGEQAGELSHEARERIRLAGLRTRDFADENPLIVGAVAIAAGVGVGLLLPATQPENRLLGETRDRLLGDARGLIGDAKGILDDARDTARATAEQLGQRARETAQEVRGAVSDARISH